MPEFDFGTVQALIAAAARRDAAERKRAQRGSDPGSQIPGADETYEYRIGDEPQGERGSYAILYHPVWNHETYEDAMTALDEMVRKAVSDFPSKRKMLLVEIQSHRDSNGFLDTDMTDLIYNIHDAFAPYLNLVVTPIAVMLANARPLEDFPDKTVLDVGELPEGAEVTVIRGPLSSGLDDSGAGELRGHIKRHQRLYDREKDHSKRPSGAGAAQSRAQRWVFTDLLKEAGWKPGSEKSSAH